MHPNWDAETSGDEFDDFELCFLWNVGRTFVAAPDQRSRHPPPLRRALGIDRGVDAAVQQYGQPGHAFERVPWAPPRPPTPHPGPSREIQAPDQQSRHRPPPRRALGTDRNVDAAVQQYVQPGHAFEQVSWAPPRPPTPHPGPSREIQGPVLGNIEHVTEEVQQGASWTGVVISSSFPRPARSGVAMGNLTEHGQEDNNTYRRNPILHPVRNRAVPAGNTEDGSRQQEVQPGLAGINLLYVRRPSSIYRRTPSVSTSESSATEATDTTDKREGAPSSKMPRMSE